MKDDNTIEQRALWWLLNGSVGASSKTLCAFMLGLSPTKNDSVPCDADDRSRCIKLLKLIPEWISRLDEIIEEYPYQQFGHSWGEQIEYIKKELK